MQNPNPMNPSDNRNLIIFMLVTIALYFAYDYFILKPHAKQLEAMRASVVSTQDSSQAQSARIDNMPTTLKAAEPIEQPVLLPFENDYIEGAINLTGGAISSVALKKYHQSLDDKVLVKVLHPMDEATDFSRMVRYGWVAGDSIVALPDKKTRWHIASSNTTLALDRPVTLYWDNAQGLRFEREISIDDQYAIKTKQRIVNNSGDTITVYPYGLVTQKGLPNYFEGRSISHEGPIAYVGGELESVKYKSIRKQEKLEYQASTGWAGMTDKYWLTAMVPPQGQDVKYRYHYSGTPPKKKQKDTGYYQVDYTGAALVIGQGQSASIESQLFVGPKKVILLNEYSKKLGVEKLDLAVDFGMFWFFTVPFFYGIHYLGLLTGNMGIAIILLTLIIRTAASPLTYQSYKSFAKMKKVMPRVNKLREEYGEDKQKLQQEMMALYQREGVNPAAGCIPIVLQIPIFFAFYKVLFVTIEMRHAPFFGWIKDLSVADPTSIFNAFGLIPWTPPEFLMIGAWPCMMLIAMQIQRKLNPPPTDPIQRDMARWFPLMMTFIMARFASGLVIYWTVSALFGNIQQIVIMRKMGVPIHLFGETSDEEIEEANKKAEKAEEETDHKDEPKVIENIKPPKPRKKKKK